MNKKYFLAIALVILGKFAMSQCVASFTFSQPTNDTTKFTSTSTAVGALLYNWNFGDHSADSSSSLKNPKHFFVTKCKKYNVCLTITDTANYCINTICDTVYVTSPSMVANFTYVNSGVTVNATNTSTGNYATSTWDFGDGTIITQLNALHNYASTYMKDSVTLTVKNIYGCTSSTKKYIYTGCKDSFLYSIAGTSTIDSFTFTPWSNQTISSFTWTINAGNILTNTTSNPLLVALTAATNYNVCLKTKDAHSCFSTFCKNIDMSTGVNNITSNFADAINLFPNPANDKLTVSFNLNNANKIDFTLIDMLGRQIFTNSKTYINEGLKQETFDLSKTATGVYMLELKDQNKTSLFKKVIVSKN